MAGCFTKIGNTSILDNEVGDDLGNVGEVDIFPMEPEQSIR